MAADPDIARAEPGKAGSLLVAALLAAVAGFVDAACFIGLKSVFTAHVTGNLAALASALVRPSAQTILRFEVIAAFAAGVVLAFAASTHSQGRQRPHASPAPFALGVEFGLLALLVAAHFAIGGTAPERHVAACLGGAAMGCQSALSKLVGETGRPTTVMTTNLTQWILLLAAWTIERDPPARRDTRRRCVSLFARLAMFAAGAALGALAQQRFGFASLAAPLVVLVVAGFAARESG